MPKPLTVSFAQAYAAVGNDLLTRLGDAQAALAGPPIGDPVAPATDADRVEAWNARNPAATDEAMLALAQQKYQEHLASGMPADVAQKATAEDLTHFRYGQRLKLYTYGQVGFSEQVTEAQRLAKLARRETTPNPPMPPPTMPSAALTNLTTLGVAPQAAPATAPPPLTGALSPRSGALSPIPRAEAPLPPEPPTPGGY